MGTEASTPVSFAEANDGQKYVLISEAKARQLFELTLQLQSAREDNNARWLPGREPVVAGVASALRGGDSLVTESSLPWSDVLQLPLTVHWPDGSGMADLIVESLASSTLDRLRRNERVTVIFLPGTNGGGLSAEARTLATSAKLPVIFIERGQASAQPVNGKGSEEMPAIPVDANDVVAVYRVAHESVMRARTGGGPTRVACVSWRAAGRTGKPEELGEDAAVRLERWLTAHGHPAQAWRDQIAARQRTRQETGPHAEAAPNGHTDHPGARRTGYRPEPQLFARPDIQSN
ncbi:MAG TPA: thiamine pyrophosphate-dependent enzyme [Acidobacteriaceae bacterium]|jgi:hypothetical protein|nr:thiamine pyrophosphate-dependent enzyme [Acidobacteriaceae bacterium]